MNRLPQEIVNEIASCVERRPDQSHIPLWEQAIYPSNLPPLATISRPWKEAIESITFRELTLPSTDLDHFEQFVTDRRRQQLKRLEFEVVLLSYSNEACAQVESATDRAGNDECYTAAVSRLFKIVSSWGDADQNLLLSFSDVYSPMDQRRRGRKKATADALGAETGEREDIFERRYTHSLLRLSPGCELPSVSRISTLSIGRNERRVDPSAAVQIAASLPKLRSLWWDLDDICHPSQALALRPKKRIRFAEALDMLTLPRLETATITLYHEPPTDQRAAPHSLLPGSLLYDPVSASLRRFSYHLTELHLTGVVDAGLFWPTDDEPAAATPPAWPHLRKLSLALDPTTPAGGWYFGGSAPPGPVPAGRGGSLQWVAFRSVPDAGALRPLLLALGRAGRRMPRLEHAVVACTLEDDERGPSQFEVSFHGPGVPALYGDEGEGDVAVRRLYFEVGSYRPDEEVMEELRGVGREAYGEMLIERFLESQY